MYIFCTSSDFLANKVCLILYYTIMSFNDPEKEAS